MSHEYQVNDRVVLALKQLDKFDIPETVEEYGTVSRIGNTGRYMYVHGDSGKIYVRKTDSDLVWHANAIHEMDVVSAYPDYGSYGKSIPARETLLWYRLMALRTLSKVQMNDMLAFIAGYDGNMFDMACESATAKSLGNFDA